MLLDRTCRIYLPPPPLLYTHTCAKSAGLTHTPVTPHIIHYTHTHKVWTVSTPLALISVQERLDRHTTPHAFRNKNVVYYLCPTTWFTHSLCKNSAELTHTHTHTCHTTHSCFQKQKIQALPLHFANTLCEETEMDYHTPVTPHHILSVQHVELTSPSLLALHTHLCKKVLDLHTHPRHHHTTCF